MMVLSGSGGGHGYWIAGENSEKKLAENHKVLRVITM